MRQRDDTLPAISARDAETLAAMRRFQVGGEEITGRAVAMETKVSREWASPSMNRLVQAGYVHRDGSGIGTTWVVLVAEPSGIALGRGTYKEWKEFKTRKCLKCHTRFRSRAKHQFICTPCKDSPEWRSGDDFAVVA